jgi:prevent-host-death family protein
MQQIVNTDEASKHLPGLIEAVISGEEIIITKDEQPVVKLVPVSKVKKRWPAKAGSAKGLVTMSDDFDEPLEDFKDYM